MNKIAIEDIYKALDHAVERDKIVVAALLWYRSLMQVAEIEQRTRERLSWTIQTYLDNEFGSASAAMEYLEGLDG